MIHVSSQFRIIGVQGDDDLLLVHQCSVIRDRIDDLELVSPPIGEGRRGCAMLCHRIGNFVSFEDVLKGSDGDMEFIAQFDQSKDLILAIAMAMDPSFTA